MLTAQQRFIEMKTRSGDWILAAGVGGALLALLIMAAVSVDDWTSPHPTPENVALAESKTTTQLGGALIGYRADKLSQPNERLRGGMSGYLLLFEIAAIHLLVVLVGAAYLARSKRISLNNTNDST